MMRDNEPSEMLREIIHMKLITYICIYQHTYLHTIKQIFKIMRTQHRRVQLGRVLGGIGGVAVHHATRFGCELHYGADGSSRRGRCGDARRACDDIKDTLNIALNMTIGNIRR